MLRQAHLQEEILVFTRYPRPGKVKTRLIPQLGCVKAAALHKYLTERALAVVRELLRSRNARVSLWYTGGTRSQMQTWVGSDVLLVEQRGNGLGQRMADAFHASWASGRKRAVLIGTDCPGLDPPLIARALDQLHTCDVVIGPAHDGGYYLIGLRREAEHNMAALFSGIAWGTADAFSQTIAQANRAGLTTATLKELHDIDRPEDLDYLRHYTDPE